MGQAVGASQDHCHRRLAHVARECAQGIVKVARRCDRLAMALFTTLSTLTCNGSESTNPGPAVTQVVFTTQPPATVEGDAIISPAVQATIRDSSGGVVPKGLVTMSVGTAPWPAPGSRISGTLTVSAVNGVATFADVRLDKPGVGYTLVATSGAARGTSIPFNVGLTFTDLAAGGLHTCALTTRATYCWGANLYGQLGGPTGAVVADSVPVLVRTSVQFVQVAGGEQHTCALTAGGAAYCWGHNDQDELGDGTTNGPDQCPGAQTLLVECHTTPVQVAGSGISPLTFTSLSSGPLAYHTCSLAGGGVAYCWGYNYSGQLGDGTTTNQPTPVQVMGSGTAPLLFSSVSAGGVNTCGATTGYAAYCWGFGFGPSTQVAGSGASPLTFTSLSARRLHTCGLTTDGAAYCWGSNSLGELGDGTITSSSTPVHVVGSGASPLVFTSVSAGDLHTCGTTGDGGVYCWGFNANGQLGDGTTANRTAPVLVVGSGAAPLLFTSVAGGEAHTCGLTISKAIYCWGYGSDGELGNGARNNQLTPFRIVQ